MIKRMIPPKNALTRRIIEIVLALILIGGLIILVGAFAFSNYSQRITRVESKSMEIYLREVNNDFMLINTNLRNMLSSSSELATFNEAQATWENSNVSEIVHYNRAINDIKDAMRNLSHIYGSEYNFFYYKFSDQKIVEYGNNDYGLRKSIIDQAVMFMADGSMQLTQNGRWFLFEDSLCTSFRSTDGIIGCWILVDDLIQNMFQASPTEYVTIDLADQIQGTVLRFEKTKTGFRHTELDEAADNWEEEPYYTMKNAAVACRFIRPSSEYITAILYPVVLLLIVIIYLAVVAAILRYTKKHIFDQVRDFRENLFKNRDTLHIDEKNGLIEFAEASKVMNQLTDEIQKLKIGIYEEQIAKQKAELDYAEKQIRPHFYINCLNVLHSLAQLNMTKEIQNISMLVAKYLRSILKKGTVPVTIESEISFIYDYVNMIGSLNATQYECQIYVDEPLRTFLIPPILIQTFVENSIKSNMDLGENLCVSVRVEEISQPKYMCAIRITDNGHGFSDALLEKFRNGEYEDNEKGHHIGIKNAIVRLQLMYGEEAHIEFDNTPNGGAEVLVLIPIKDNIERRLIREGIAG